MALCADKSSPETTWKEDGQSLIIFFSCSRSGFASLIPIIFLLAESLKTVSADKLHPVLEGTLYKTIGNLLFKAISLKWLNNPSWLGRL